MSGWVGKGSGKDKPQEELSNKKAKIDHEESKDEQVKDEPKKTESPRRIRPIFYGP